MKLSNDLLTCFLSHAAPGNNIAFMFTLWDYSKEEWKCWGMENKLNYFVQRNTVVEIDYKEHAN